MENEAGDGGEGGMFEIREYVDDEGHEVGKNELVDLTKELAYVQQMARNQKTKEDDADEDEGEGKGGREGAAPSASNAGQLNLQPPPARTTDEAFIAELSLLADQAKLSPEEGDVIEAIERIERRASKVSGSRDKIEGKAWKKGFFG